MFGVRCHEHLYPLSLLELLAKDQARYARSNVAANPSTPASLLEELAKDARPFALDIWKSKAMPIPDYQSLIRPVLEKLAPVDGWVKTEDVIEALATDFGLTQEERARLRPKGQGTVFANLVHWARAQLIRARLVEGKPDIFRITERGREVLATGPARIDIKFLRQFFDPDATRVPTSLADHADIDRAALLKAMDFFDTTERDTAKWANWTDNRQYRYAIHQDAKLYPVKQIVARAARKDVGSFSGGEGHANDLVRRNGLEVVLLREEDVAPYLPSFIAGLCSRCGPFGTGLRTRLG